MNFKTDLIVIGSSEIHFLEYDDFVPEHYLDRLSEIEIENFKNFKNIKRKREFVATRLLRHDLFGFKHIHYSPIGAPYIKDEGFISISHSQNLIGIATNKQYQIGLDLEQVSDKALRLHSKFLNENEIQIFDTQSEIEMTQCWSAKEALYKLAGRNGIDFKTELILGKDPQNRWSGKIYGEKETISVELHIFEYKNQVITINSNPVVSAKH